MILPDANLLLYAYNSDLGYHARSAAWWSKVLSGAEPVCLCPLVLFAFVRISTTTRAFPHPMTIAEASAHVEEWLQRPNVQVATVEEGDIAVSLQLLREAGTGGNLTTDAQIAALAQRLGATIHTADGDYARFPGVRWLNPLAGRRHR
jgi:toxin-antitoxin system PIN domain toxin